MRHMKRSTFLVGPKATFATAIGFMVVRLLEPDRVSQYYVIEMLLITIAMLLFAVIDPSIE